MPPALRPLVLAAAVVAGAAAGVLGSFIHAYVVVHVPLGLVVGLALSGAVFAAAGLLAAARSGAGFAAVGWLLVVLVLTSPRPEGDLVVPATGLGYAWLLGGVLVAGLALTVPYRDRRLGVGDRAGELPPSATPRADR